MACEAALNMDLERKRELDRRKKLRLLQVRQQSKDFAKTLRENVQADEIRQRHIYLELRRKQIQQEQLKELERLQKLYQSCVQAVGSSHREAAKQPNVNAIKQAELAKGLAIASARGAEAMMLQKVNQISHRQKIEAPIVKKQNTRNRENLRSFFVASLPKPTVGRRKQSTCFTQAPSKVSACKKQIQVLQNLPSNLPSLQPDLQSHGTNENALKDTSTQVDLEEDTQYCSENKDSNKRCELALEKNTCDISPLRDCSCDYIVCGCHTSPRGLRRSHSESVVSSENNFSEVRETTSKRVKTRSRSCSPRSVRTLNYCDVGNLYESNQQNFTTVIHHTSPLNNKEENTNCGAKHSSSEKKVISEDLKKKTEERSVKAVQREQLKKDFKQLLQDLGNLSRGKANLRSKKSSKTGVYQQAREVSVKKELKQRKLAAAFETLIHTSAKPTPTNTSGTGQVSELPGEVEEPSVPSLNLALYQEVNMYQGGSSYQLPSVTKIRTCEEVTLTQAPPSQSVGTRRSRSPHGVCPSRSESPRGVCPSRSGSPRGVCPSGSRSPHGLSPSRSPYSQATQVSSRNNLPSHSQQICQELPQNMQANVKLKGHKKKCKKHQDHHILDSSTSYFSPPEYLTPSEKFLVDTLLIRINTKGLNRDLKKYIKKLLSMSRESIDDLNVSAESACVESARRSPEKEIEEDYYTLSNLTRLYADQVDTLVNLFEECDTIYSNSSDSERFYSPPGRTLHGPSPEDQVQLEQFPHFSNSPPEQHYAPEFPPIECFDEQYLPQKTLERRDPPSRIPPPINWPTHAPDWETPVSRQKANRHDKCHQRHERQDTYFPRNPRKPTTSPMQKRPKPCPPQSSRLQEHERPTRQTSSPCVQATRSLSQERRTGHSPCPQTSRSQSRDQSAGRTASPYPQARRPPSRERPTRQTRSPCPQASRPQSRERPTRQTRSPCPQASRPQSRERPAGRTASPCPQASRPQSRERPTRQTRSPCPQASRPQSRERLAGRTASPCPQKSGPQFQERPQTPRRTPCPPSSPIQAERQVGCPPDSVHSRKPRLESPQRTPQSTRHRPVQVQTPFGLSSNLLPHPREVFGQQQEPSPPQGPLTPISEYPERENENVCGSPVGEADSSFDPFHNLPVRPQSIIGSTSPCPGFSDTDDTFDYANFDEEAELKRHGMENYFSHVKEMLDEVKAEKERAKQCGNQPTSFGNDFGQDPDFCDSFTNQTLGDDLENEASPFGGYEFEGQEDWGELGFGDEEFTNNADIILQTGVPNDNFVDYPLDFPPPTDVFGPGFDWSTANQTEPSWPHSFPGRPLGGSSMSDNDYIALDCLDTHKDIEALSYPPNASKINHLRKKLSEICNTQYREVIQMLQDDLSRDQNRFNNILKRVDSSPVYDANATLAPIPHIRAKSPSPGRPINTEADSSFESNFSSRYRDILHDKNIDNLTSLSILADHQEKYDLNECFNREFQRQSSPESCESLLQGIAPLGDSNRVVDKTRNASCVGGSSSVASSNQSPLNMCNITNISQRLSPVQVTGHHYQKLVKLLGDKSDKENNLIVSEVCSADRFCGGGKFSKTKSLALLEALRIGS